MNISAEAVELYKSMTPTNPINITCNPYDTQYTGEPCETTPPQDPDLIELWEEAVCGVIYSTTNLDGNQCPAEYSLQSFRNKEEADAAGATLTHWGACGVCSTTQDLAVYIENVDLTTLGVECSVAAIFGEFEDGVRCYMRAGYTRVRDSVPCAIVCVGFFMLLPGNSVSKMHMHCSVFLSNKYLKPCATMWVYNARQTQDFCEQTCVEFRLDKRPNNGDPPQCVLDDCLECDEVNAGPLFQKIAARSRRRSGLISKIARDCSAILFVDHQSPCDVINGVTRETTQGDVCQIKEIQDFTPREVRFEGDLGLMSFEDQENNGGLFGQDEDSLYASFYGVCNRYDAKRVKSGFWKDVADETLGAPWKAAKSFGLISSVLGIVCFIFLWTAACVAYPRAFWNAICALLAVCGLFDFLTLVFLASPACDNGCTLQYAGYLAIVSGIVFWINAVLCWRVGQEGLAMVYIPLVYDIAINEYVQSDGTKVSEKITIRPNRTRVVERTTVKTKKESKQSPGKSLGAGVVVKSVEAEEPVRDGGPEMEPETPNEAE
jgi:hypothetical protein